MMGSASHKIQLLVDTERIGRAYVGGARCGDGYIVGKFDVGANEDGRLLWDLCAPKDLREWRRNPRSWMDTLIRPPIPHHKSGCALTANPSLRQHLDPSCDMPPAILNPGLGPRVEP
ncbi:hypothetical protein NDU88_009658 [Pleurodeles waltl]|uniref:MHC class I antigen n=1 Tax=Pleurodeles waltl TaxID=8319 RepID=A0AAV7RWV6_PLEWA|nr:hypothetical protein NDU88_009658 [Pleurodeles waltl]